jgi:outer membrane autotransporter protein
MNRTHSIIWSQSHKAFVVASENAKAKGKPSSTRKVIVASVIAALGALATMPSLAVTSCPGLGGPINVTGADDETCNLVAGDTLTVNGSIAPTSTTANAVNAVGINSIGSITNNGTISSFNGTVGINLNNTTLNGSITNAAGGVIASTTPAQGTGILIFGSTVGSINNSGTISGGLYGIFILPDIIFSPTNSSSIISNVASNVTGGITNSGTISGGAFAIDVDPSVFLPIDIIGTASQINGDVNADSADVTVKAGATFANTNAFEVRRFTVENTATFNMGDGQSPSGFLSDGITVSNGFFNNGSVVIADGVTAPIFGDYTQAAGAVLEIGASSAASHGTLFINGIANLTAGTGIRVNVAGVNTLTNGDTLAGVIQSSVLNASTFTVTDNSALFDFTALINGNAVDLLLNATSSSGILSAVASEGFKAGTGAATVLDGFVTGGTTGTDMDNVVTAFGQLPNDPAITDAVAQTLPNFTGGLSQITLNTLHDTNRVIQARQESNRGLSSGDGFLGDRKFWLKPVGSWAKQNNRDGVAGYDADTFGFVGGVDGEINELTRIGVALSYMRTDVDGKSTSSGNHADIDAYTAIVYGSRSLDAKENTEINWQADLGINDNDSRRRINFGGLNREAKADYDSVTAHLGVGIGTNYMVTDKTTLAPALRADYYWIREDGYTEKGAGALNLKVKSHSTDQLILMAEGRLSHAFTDKATLLANLGVGYDVLNDENSIAASFVGGGATFTTKGLDPSPWLGRAGLGLAVRATETVEISARYDVEARSDFFNQTASAKVRWSF